MMRGSFRDGVRQWIDENRPRGLEEIFDWRASERPGHYIEERSAARDHSLYREWEVSCVEAGMVCQSWPSDFGGQGWTRRQKVVFEEELHRVGLPRIDRGMGEFLLGPTLIERGTPEQQRRLLQGIVSGDDVYCQGFSEPGRGSDLAGVQTRGVLEGDELVLTGQKVWTSGAADATMMFGLCRTDREVPKHRGLTFFILPMGEGQAVDVRPIRQITGSSEFAEVFLDGARTSVDNIIGEPGDGWSVAMTALGFERDFNLPTLSLQYGHELDLIADRERERLGGDLEPAEVGRWWTSVSVMRGLAGRLLDDEEAAVRRGLASVSKLHWSEYLQRITERSMELEGIQGLERPRGEGYPTTPTQDRFLAGRAGTIFAGTSQIQRNIIAERVLGLPR